MFDIFGKGFFDLNHDGKLAPLEKALAYDIIYDDDEEDDTSDSCYDDDEDDDDDFFDCDDCCDDCDF